METTMKALTNEEINQMFGDIGRRKRNKSGSDDSVDRKQRKGFEQLFKFPRKNEPYECNLDYLEDVLRLQAQQFVLLRAQIRPASSEDSFEANAHDFLFHNPNAVTLAKKSSRELEVQIRKRLKSSAFTPGLIQVARRHSLNKRDTAIVLTVFMMKFANREINLGHIAEVYAKGFRQKVQFKSYMQSTESTIGKGVLYTKHNLFDEPTLHMHGDIFNLILGESLIQEEYMTYGTMNNRAIAWESVILPEEEKERVYTLLSGHNLVRRRLSEWGYDRVSPYGLGSTILFHGKSGTGKTMFAHALATRLGKRLICADGSQIIERSDTAGALRSLLLQARLQDAILFLDECEYLLGNSEYRSIKLADILRVLEESEGIILMATNSPDEMDPAMRRRILHMVRFEVPGAAAREMIWRTHITREMRIEDDVDLSMLAEKYELTGGQIKNAVILAASVAVNRNPQEPIITRSDLEQAADQQRRSVYQLTDGDDVAFYDQYNLQSLVYSDSVSRQISSLVTACRRRHEFWRGWGFAEKFSRAMGICALFNGPSGTGKTAAAYAIATELGLPVRTIEFASVQSKWFGDTERNMLRLFGQLKAKDEVVLLDECDSLLSSREGMESKTRTNIVNIFLRQLEAFDGILLMTTNLKQELDPALERRLLYRLDFGVPNAEMRERIWRASLPAKAPFAPDIDWKLLADEYDLTGGQIKNCLVSAMYSALSDGDAYITFHHIRQACATQLIGFERRKKIGFARSG